MWDRYQRRNLYLDSNIVIFAVESGYQWNDMLRDLFERIDDGSILAATSELTLAEVLAKPLVSAEHDLVTKYESMFATGSTIMSVPVDKEVLREAASLQGQLGIKLIDAIHVASSRQTECDYFLTNDVRLGRKLGAGSRWLSLGEVERNGAADG
jgi:predicted nucleic acid-binding protein